MKLSYWLLLTGIIGLFACQNPTGQTYNMATYNIRFDNPRDSGNLWQDRLPHVVAIIQFHQFKLFGIQEGMRHQVEALSQATGYPYIGIGRDAGDNPGEYSAIFYDTLQFTALDQGTFWLSETPEVASVGWDAALNRICTWAKFSAADGQLFYVFNTHFDHVGQQAREESSRLIMQQIEAINPSALPVILMGDFNVAPDNPAYQHIVRSGKLRDARLSSPVRSVMPRGTFNGFNWADEPKNIIDHVFLSKGVTVHRYGILTDNYGLKYPSDHFPVMVEVAF